MGKETTGLREGFSDVGECDGFDKVGEDDGLLDEGVDVGECEGLADVGECDGCDVVGEADGLPNEGAEVGLTVLGDTDGIAVGKEVGRFVGDVDGTCVVGGVGVGVDIPDPFSHKIIAT